jgi:hypothetical protein
MKKIFFFLMLLATGFLLKSNESAYGDCGPKSKECEEEIPPAKPEITASNHFISKGDTVVFSCTKNGFLNGCEWKYDETIASGWVTNFTFNSVGIFRVSCRVKDACWWSDYSYATIVVGPNL